jgi:peptide-methionine (S)-S-oxide reductase
MKQTLTVLFVLAAAAVAVLANACSRSGGDSTEERSMSKASTIGKQSESGPAERAYFAAGCFWGVEAAFRRVEGVLTTAVGYSGGHAENPTYHQVCGGHTGHAETVEVVFDPERVSFGELMDVFWRIHDPTMVNRQGPDVGSQYRSAIFFVDDQQEDAAREAIRRLEDSGKYRRPVATEVARLNHFWRAEEYHQQYLEKRNGTGCRVQ